MSEQREGQLQVIKPPFRLFYCYARKDQALRNELDKHLKGLHHGNLITSWYDGMIVPGKPWEREIETNLNASHIILLLISPDFIDSDYCYNKEMQRAIERHLNNEARVIPILLRSVDWAGMPFSEIQMLPTDAKPINMWGDKDAAFEDVARGIRRVVEDLRQSQHKEQYERNNTEVQNPFTRGIFWGRQRELRAIYHYLQSSPPQSCALIGETYSGKTTLLRRLVDVRKVALSIEERAIRENYAFVYLDCIAYYSSELAQKGAYASLLFWWELYSEAYAKLQSPQREKLSRPDFSTERQHLETAFEIKLELEDIIRDYPHHVVIVLDNFEGVANLQRLNSHWLRALCQSTCTLIVASRHLLYLTYQYDARDQQDYSPLWNLFSDPIYLGLMDEDEVTSFLELAHANAAKQNRLWRRGEIDFIRRMAGRHPGLIRLVCRYMFEHPIGALQEQELLEFNIVRDARPICRQLWLGLDDTELRIEFPLVYARSKMEHENQGVSPYQAALLEIAYGRKIVENNAFFLLKQRGLIEYRDNKWQVFSEIMKRFVLERGGYTPVFNVVTQVDKSSDQRHKPAFSYLESKVYDYLYSRLGQVCDRGEIQNAVWQSNIPSNGALQKIIERVREKIENDAESMLHLVAVRGKGYMLRFGTQESE